MEKKKNDLWEIIKEKKYLFGIVIGFWLASLVLTLFLKFCCYKDMSALGAVGDTFGAINALFSGLALAGMIATLIMQKEELELQREELKETRNEMKTQTEQFESQTRMLNIQLFENTYYTMLNQQERIVDDLQLGENLKGKAAINFAISSLIEIASKKLDKDFEKKLEKCYTFFPYLNHIIQIFKYVDDNKFFSIYEKYDYLQKLTSTFWKSEIQLLSIYGLKNDRLKSVIEKYGLLESIKVENICQEVKNTYDIGKATKFISQPIYLEVKKYELYSYWEGHYIYKIECNLETKNMCYIDHIKLKNKDPFMYSDIKEKIVKFAFRNLQIEIKGLKYMELFNKINYMNNDAEEIDHFKLSQNTNFVFLGGFVTPYFSDYSYFSLPKDNWTIEISIENNVYEFPLCINEIEEKDLGADNTKYQPFWF